MTSVEQRLRAVEDRLEIQDLVARYGPAVDAADGAALEKMWTASGSYRIDGVELSGSEIPALVDLPTHRGYLHTGCAHLLTPPRIELDGDRASAVNHSCVLLASPDGWRAERVSANRWTFVRTPEGWRVETREAKLVVGPESARALFATQP